jgi:hypothetical protein
LPALLAQSLFHVIKRCDKTNYQRQEQEQEQEAEKEEPKKEDIF